jgi:hypothetical protein
VHDLDGYIVLDDFVHPLRQRGFVERVFFQVEIETCMVGVNGTSGDRRIDKAAKDV